MAEDGDDDADRGGHAQENATEDQKPGDGESQTGDRSTRLQSPQTETLQMVELQPAKLEFEQLSEERQVGVLVNMDDPHSVDCAPTASSDTVEAAVIRLLQFNTWYRFGVLLLTTASIALGIYTTWLALQIDAQSADCEVPVPVGEDPLTYNTPCSTSSFFCNREQCCSCAAAEPAVNCSATDSAVCAQLIEAQCGPGVDLTVCFTTHINDGMPTHMTTIDATNLGILAVLLLDLALCLHYLSKSLCYCRCCTLCTHSDKCRCFQRTRSSGRNLHAIGSSRQRPCDVVCCCDIVDDELTRRLNGRHHFCCMCRPESDIIFDHSVHLSCSDVAFFWVDFGATVLSIGMVILSMAMEAYRFAPADDSAAGGSNSVKTQLTATVLSNLAVRIVVQVVKSVRLLNVCRVVHTRVLKRVVGLGKSRFVKRGFDLDLTYITPRVVAMSLPSTGQTSMFRNAMADVMRCLDYFHGTMYFVANLCSEHQYKARAFHGRFHRVPFPDHNPPTIQTLSEFLTVHNRWLDQAPTHVSVVHCQGGKGRTGMMIAALLVYRYHVTPERALRLFAMQRSFDKQRLQARVTNPSQRRFVHYAREMSRGRLIVEPASRAIVVQRVYVRSCTLGKSVALMKIRLRATARVTPVVSITSKPEHQPSAGDRLDGQVINMPQMAAGDSRREQTVRDEHSLPKGSVLGDSPNGATGSQVGQDSREDAVPGAHIEPSRPVQFQVAALPHQRRKFAPAPSSSPCDLDAVAQSEAHVDVEGHPPSSEEEKIEAAIDMTASLLEVANWGVRLDGDVRFTVEVELHRPVRDEAKIAEQKLSASIVPFRTMSSDSNSVIDTTIQNARSVDIEMTKSRRVEPVQDERATENEVAFDDDDWRGYIDDFGFSSDDGEDSDDSLVPEETSVEKESVAANSKVPVAQRKSAQTSRRVRRRRGFFCVSTQFADIMPDSSHRRRQHQSKGDAQNKMTKPFDKKFGTHDPKADSHDEYLHHNLDADDDLRNAHDELAEARLELTPTSSLANIASALGTESKTTADRIGCSHGLQQFVIHKADIDQLHKVKRIPDDLQIVVEYTRGTESLNQLGAIPEEDSNITAHNDAFQNKEAIRRIKEAQQVISRRSSEPISPPLPPQDFEQADDKTQAHAPQLVIELPPAGAHNITPADATQRSKSSTPTNRAARSTAGDQNAMAAAAAAAVATVELLDDESMNASTTQI